MTRKDYNAIASGIRDVDAVCVSEESREIVSEIVNHLCYVFALDNPRFDAARFRLACYGE